MSTGMRLSENVARMWDRLARVLSMPITLQSFDPTSRITTGFAARGKYFGTVKKDSSRASVEALVPLNPVSMMAIVSPLAFNID